MYPTIYKLSDLVPFIESNPQFRIQEQPNGYTVVCYMLQDEDTFRGENEAYAQECRGITFDREGNIASRTLHKFENVGQSDASQPENIPWNRIVRVMDKRDGSMITFLEIDGQIVGKTKKTFTSNEAIAATEFLNKDPVKVAWVRDCLRQGFTPTFEWTSPRFPIVLTYNKDELTLLQIRHNESGMYPMFTLLNPNFQSEVPFPIVENLLKPGMDPRDLLEQAKTAEGIEGWIIQDDNGRMWKIKTLWYVKLHNSVTFTRWRDIARTVLADEADDLKAAFTMTGRSIEPILEVERKIHAYIAEQEAGLKKIVEEGRGLPGLEMHTKHHDHPRIKQIMRVHRGANPDEINWRDIYLKERIRDWNLEVIVQNEDIEVPTTEEV